MWVDETGCIKQGLIRKYGYSFGGESKGCWLEFQKRISAIAAMCWDKGILDIEMTSKGEMFCDYVRGTLIPNMLPG